MNEADSDPAVISKHFIYFVIKVILWTFIFMQRHEAIKKGEPS